MEPYEGKEPFIFISYAHKDADIVMPYVEELSRRGYRVWCDKFILTGTADYSNVIIDHLCQCRVMLVFLTNNYLNSLNCMNELQNAYEENLEACRARNQSDYSKIHLNLLQMREDFDYRLSKRFRLNFIAYQRQAVWKQDMPAAMSDICSGLGMEECKKTAAAAAKEEPENSMILGIDLGTTYSVCSYVDGNGEPQVVYNQEGQRITPSVVYFESENSVIVGQNAKENSICYSNQVVSAIKNHMGDSQYRFTPSSQHAYTPEEISAFILKKVVNDANAFLGAEPPIKKVIITIPAYFTDAERYATENAARIAGLKLVRTINEPTAAALYYAVKCKADHGNIMIYDLGGGTFDVTIAHVDGKEVSVVSTKGLKNVGGRFFDEEIVSLIRDQVEDELDIDLEDEEYIDIYQELFCRVEKAKISLMSMKKVSIPIRIGEHKTSYDLTRAELEKIVSKLYKRTEYCIKNALKDAMLETKDITKVILVGGSSRIPYIEKQLTELMGIVPSHEVNPDEVVAMGAALYGKQLTSEGGSRQVISDVCSHSIGVVATDQVTKKQYNKILIRRNTKVPCSSSQLFKTASENQEVIKLTVTEGEFKELSDVKTISENDVHLPANLPRGTRVEVKIGLDASQLAHVWIRIPDVFYEKEFMIERLSNMSEEQITKSTGIIADCEVN